VNLRQDFYSQSIIVQSLQLANVLKLNEEELDILKGMLGLPGEYREQIRVLSNSYELHTIVLTCGAQGSLMYREGEWSELQGKHLEVVDTVGAGDAFTAGMTVGLLSGFSLDEVHRLADKMARKVCAQLGGI